MLRIEFFREVEQINDSSVREELCKNLQDHFRGNLASKRFLAWFAIKDNQIIGTSGIVFYFVPLLFSNKKGKEAYIMDMYILT